MEGFEELLAKIIIYKNFFQLQKLKWALIDFEKGRLNDFGKGKQDAQSDISIKALKCIFYC